jgi:hypothetical protein
MFSFIYKSGFIESGMILPKNRFYTAKAIFQCLFIVLQNSLCQLVKRVYLVESAFPNGKVGFQCLVIVLQILLCWPAKQVYLNLIWIFNELSSKTRFVITKRFSMLGYRVTNLAFI